MSNQAEVMSNQLAEMRTTSVDTHILALAAKEAAEASAQQAKWAEHHMDSLMRQEGVMINQSRIMLTQTEAAIISAQAAKDSAAATLRQLEVYERPWLTVSIASMLTPTTLGEFVFADDGGAYVWFNLAIKNIGKSVATNVTVATRLVAIKAGDVAISPTELETATVHPGEFTLFPEETINNRIFDFRTISSSEVNAKVFTLETGGAEFVRMALVGRVTYLFANSIEPHNTDFAFSIARKHPEYGGAIDFLVRGTKLSGDDLAWRKLGDHAT